MAGVKQGLGALFGNKAKYDDALKTLEAEVLKKKAKPVVKPPAAVIVKKVKPKKQVFTPDKSGKKVLTSEEFMAKRKKAREQGS